MDTSVVLAHITDTEAADEIREMTERFVHAVDPLKVFLFGSFAKGTYTNESDYDFYLVVDDGRNISDTTDQAYRSIRYDRKRPVDIVVGTNSRFARKGPSKHTLMVEGEVWRTGILLYEKAPQRRDEA